MPEDKDEEMLWKWKWNIDVECDQCDEIAAANVSPLKYG